MVCAALVFDTRVLAYQYGVRFEVEPKSKVNPKVEVDKCGRRWAKVKKAKDGEVEPKTRSVCPKKKVRKDDSVNGKDTMVSSANNSDTLLLVRLLHLLQVGHFSSLVSYLQASFNA